MIPSRTAHAAQPLDAAAFGDRLRALMERDGWSVRRFASAIHCSPTTVQRWRSGTDGPDYERLVAVCRLLGDNPSLPEPPPRAAGTPTRTHALASGDSAPLEALSDVVNRLEPLAPDLMDVLGRVQQITAERQ
jgi:transcriptional regulator with XRE-family HTH domain